jgi:hypothetical protein
MAGTGELELQDQREESRIRLARDLRLPAGQDRERVRQPDERPWTVAIQTTWRS